MKGRLDAIAGTPRLLIAADFDGTLAPIVARPDLASPAPGAMASLRLALALPQTAVAVLTGRGLADLRERMGPLEGAWLSGGHGAELSGPHVEAPAHDASLLLESIAEPLRRLAPEGDGFLHERKPGSVAVHYRAVEPARAAAAVEAIVETVARPAGLAVRHGKMVVELMGVDADKGRALRRIQRLTGATATVYVGDDVTDEDAFAVLGSGDVAVKIGQPPTEADYVVATPEEAHALLAHLVELRDAWARSPRAPAIHDHSMLSDQRSLAVVTPDARVCWLCLPRVDGSAVFASLLGDARVGEWALGPADGSPPRSQRYLGDSFCLETAWEGMRVVDYMDGSGGRSFQRAGRTDLVRVIEGHGRAQVVFAPRLDFGRASTKIVPAEGGLLVEGTADPMVLYAPGLTWEVAEQEDGPVARAGFDLGPEPLVMELRAGTRSLAPARLPESQRRAQTERAWSAWAASLRLPTLKQELCRRSALALRALVHGPTGAILAAGTTSLPETAGGSRNWDYRFCWPRDAAVAAAALVRLGNTGVAMKFLDWLLGVVDRCAGPEKLRPIYGVTGEELGPEAELSTLPGYRGSRPVRVGNAAARQVQLDVFGPIVDLVHLLAEAGAAISPDHWRLVEAMVTAVERTWDQPDHGIWEVRTEKRHHVHTKAMCWVAVDRAIRLAEQFVGVRRETWEVLRGRIEADVLTCGFDPGLNAFVASYEHREPDAAALTLGLCGLVRPTDARFVGTVDAVLARLAEGGTVYRYVYDDGLAGPEGGFHLCTGWLIESLARIGRWDQAAEWYEHLASSAGPTGLLAEQWCPKEQTSLGNFPQAYSHAAIINATLAMEGR
jgi:trehalose 6-phosphate phosphatase